MKLFNTITKTCPIVLHSPGVREKPLFKKAKSLPFISKSQICNTTIITWNSKEEKSILEKCLDHAKIPFLVLGRAHNNWDNRSKILLAREADIKTEYVIGLDAFDVLLLDSPQEVIDRFENFGCQMVYATDRTYFPCGKDKITAKWKEFQESLTDSPYKFINGGVWVAKSSFYKQFIEECWIALNQIKMDVERGLLPKMSPPFIADCSSVPLIPGKAPYMFEQMILNRVFPQFYPQIKLDSRCEIFQVLNFCNDAVFLPEM